MEAKRTVSARAWRSDFLASKSGEEKERWELRLERRDMHGQHTTNHGTGSRVLCHAFVDLHLLHPSRHAHRHQTLTTPKKLSHFTPKFFEL